MANTPFPEYKTIPVSDLVPYARNSRTHSPQQVDKIAASIREFGFLNPVIVDAQNGIVAGHGRVLAAQKLGLSTLPCIEAAHLTEAQRKAYVLADNRLALDAGWDNELLRIELQELQSDGFNLELTGFNLDEIAGFLVDPNAGLTDPDAAPEVPVNPVTVAGDVWLLGRHRLMCGDSTSVDAVDKLVAGRKADMVFTDPPYRMDVTGGLNQPIGRAAAKLGEAIAHLCEFDPVAFLHALPLAFAKGKMNAYIFCNKDLVPDYLQWGVQNGYAFNILFWKKPNAIPLGGQYRPDMEYLLVFRKAAVWNNAVPGVSYSKLLEYGRENSTPHPTMKPVAMIENQILIASNAKALVVDFFGGSGSTLIACEKTGRDCAMIELDPKYCDVIVNRWQTFTGMKAVLEGDGRTFEELEAERHDKLAA